MRIGPLFKWFGSKWNSSKYYPTPQYDKIIEPFCGGAGYSLNHVDKQVVLFDNDKNVWALWEWLINTASHCHEAVSSIPINLPEGSDIRKLGLTTGQELLLKHWQRTNNVGECWTISPWGNKPGQWTANTRARVTEQVSAVKHWKLVNAPITLDIVDATYFIDPPYQYNYQYKTKNFDWKKLQSEIESMPLPHQIICCEARCPKTGIVPDWAPFVDFKETVTSRRKTTEHHHSKELIYAQTKWWQNPSKQ
jgi:hypothetical protein